MVIEERISDIFTDPKAVLNRGAGLLLLAYSAPVLLTLAIAVRFNTGSASILVETRHGQDDAVLWRFRTARDGDASQSTFGGFLKQTRLELLPQLANVARGEITVLNALR